MKRSLTALAIIALGLVLGAPLAASAAVPAASPDPATVIRSGVQDFAFESYTADYYLGRDEAGHAVLRTVETFVALFPKFDQNRGMIRAIPNDYDGVPLRTSVESVVDENGDPVPFEQTVNAGFTELALGTDDYVHGRTTYTISYTQQNVVRAFTDTNSDEFYWDTNGTGFPQPFGTVTARVHLDPSLSPYLTGNTACYRGAEGSTGTCDIVSSPDAAGDSFTATVRDLGPHENLTVVIGFTLGTFVQVPPEEEPDEGFPELPFLPGQTEAPWWAGAGSIAVAVLTVLGMAFTITWRFITPGSAKGRGIIIPQYTVPKELNLLKSADIIGRPWSGIPAQIVSFAVRGKLRILDYPVSNRGAQFTLQLLDTTGLDDEELELMTALFGGVGAHELDIIRNSGALDGEVLEQVAVLLGGGAGGPQIGAVREIGVVDDAVAAAIGTVRSGVRARILARGLKKKRSSLAGFLIAGLMFLLIFVAVGFFVVSSIYFSISVAGFLAIFLAFAGVFVCLGFAWRPAVLTEAGAEHRDYLLGMRDYLKLAEADRFRMLQSPEGAERVRAEGLDIRHPAQRVKLYEKLLPFAVLWGIEKEWAKELTVYYGDAAPDWFVSSGSFDATMFSMALGSIASTTVAKSTPSTSSGSSWSGSSGGSFSGGSFGGGFSGGGGGGGGGGGR